MKTKILFPLLVFFLSTMQTFAQTIHGEKLDSLLALLSAKDKAMGSLAVLEDGQLTYNNTIGFVENDPYTMASNNKTKYRIGSISKMFTAVLVFQLIDEGRLQLTTTLDTYYPQIPNAKKITIAHMLSHRSGIHNFTSDSSYSGWMTSPKTKEELVAIIASYKPDFNPDKQTEYSNSNYVLLGYILEDILFKPYNAILQSRICSRIGLNDTYFGNKTDITKNECYSFFHDGGWKKAPETDMSIPHGAGAIVSTSSDLVRFIHALYNGKLISEASLDCMQKTIENNLGMGMMTFPYNDLKLYGHGGAIDGFTSLLVYSPEHKLAVAYTSNGTVFSGNDIVIRTLNNFFDKADKLPEFTVYDLKSEDMDQYTGVYSSSAIPIKITIKKENDKLFGQGTGQPAFPLEPVARDVFTFDRAGIKMTFNPSDHSFILEQGGGKFYFTRDQKTE